MTLMCATVSRATVAAGWLASRGLPTQSGCYILVRLGSLGPVHDTSGGMRRETLIYRE